jgi:RecB family endonuclease NucS
VIIENRILIGEGLTFVGREVFISLGTRLRCDLLFRDRDEKSVCVEVKWIARRRGVIQVEQYEVLNEEDKENTRIVLTAVESKSDVFEVVEMREF